MGMVMMVVHHICHSLRILEVAATVKGSGDWGVMINGKVRAGI
jgi:hypothetical protein